MTKHLTKAEFQAKIFDYEAGADWKFAGERPCIVDFYADWCGPCKRVAPILEELSKEYEGKVDIYKVNTDAEPELAGAFGIQSIPTMLFVPMEGKPQVAVGALPREAIEKAIGTVLLAAA
jgi:thioredoxin